MILLQEIDELLSGSLTQEDEDAVLQELEEMTKVLELELHVHASVRHLHVYEASL